MNDKNQVDDTINHMKLEEIDELMINEYYDYGVKVCKEAIKLIDNFVSTDNDNRTNYDTKSCQTDLVTIVDKNVQNFIFNQIQSQYPTHRFIGEESNSNTHKIDYKNFTWILDPIDGTTNFVHNLPFYAISLGGIYKNQLVIGIVLNISTKDLYTATLGKGSFKNGIQLKVSPIKNKNEAIIMTEFGVFHDLESTKQKLDTIMSIFSENGSIHGVRSLGCASLNLCMVAEGKADAYYEWGLHCWDISAGSLIVTEAGGYIYQYNGNKFDLMARNILAVSTPSLKDQLIKHMPILTNLTRDDVSN